MSNSNSMQTHPPDFKLGVSGMRGIVGSALLPRLALEYVVAYATYLKECGRPRPLVLLGRDTRPTGEMVRHAALAGLISAGCEVIDCGIVSTPTLQLAITHLKADGAICITASHNPIEWNALKLFQPNGMYLDEVMGNRVSALYDAGEFACGHWDAMGQVRHDDLATRHHIEAVLNLVDVAAIRKKRYKVVLDGCNGAGNVISPLVIEALGCELVHINDGLDGLFPHNPEPVNENMAQLCAAVGAHGADIGFAHDADADRVAIVTNEGEPIGEDYSLVWAVDHYLKNRKRGTVVTNLSTTMAVETVARRYGCDLVRTPVGDVNVSGKMREIGAVIGGEGNGGVIIPDIQYGRDGIAALALTLDFLATGEATAAEVGRTMPRYHIAKSTVEVEKTKIKPMLQWLKSKEKTARIDTNDGLRFDWPKQGPTTSWAHVRESNTEPLVRIICEAPDAAEAERIQKSLRAEILSVTAAL